MKIYTYSRLKNRLLLATFKNLPFISGHMRANVYKYLNILQIGSNCFIGKNIHIDDIFIRNIIIGNNVMITQNASILSHFYDIKNSKNTSNHEFYSGEVKIEDNVFIGMNVVIVKPIKISHGAIIGAGVIVAENIPPNSIITNNNTIREFNE